MTVIDAYRILIREVPPAARNADGKHAHGRRLLRNWLNMSNPSSRQPILDQLGEPAKSLITSELASGRL